MKKPPDGSPNTLVQLPDGVWVNPDHVAMVTAFDAVKADGVGREFPPCVVVRVANCKDIRFDLTLKESYAEAEGLRDRIAAMLNQTGG